MDEEKLLSSRRAIKATLTRMSNYVNDNVVIDSTEATVRASKLDELYNKFDAVQSQLEECDLEKYENADDCNKFEDQFYKVRAVLEKFITVNSNSNSSNNSVAEPERLADSDSIAKKVQLPKLNIPIFTGQYNEWKNFHDLFGLIIHKNPQLTPIEKLYYLKASLKGEAQQIIQAVTPTSENYQVAWDLIVERYDNKQHNVNCHIKAISEQPLVNKDSVSGFRNLITETKQHLRSLESPELTVDLKDCMIIYLLCQKLDNTSRREWELSKPDNELPTLKAFFAFLERRCMALEAISGQDKQKKLVSGKTSLVSCNQDGSQKQMCKLCKGKHPLYQCETFANSNVDNRITAVKTTGVCYNCLRTGHGVKECRSRHCSKCGKKHNIMLLYEKRDNNTSQSRGSATDTTEDTIKGKDEAEPVTVSHCSATQAKEILLSTAIIQIKDKNGDWMDCRALLDSGSQSSFVSKALLDKLNITAESDDTPVNGIDGTAAKVKGISTLQISSRVHNYFRCVECLVLDRITCDLPQHHITTERWSIPKTMSLADPTFNKPNEVEILLGAEIFFDTLYQGRRKLGDNLPIMQNTAFGWIIAGAVPVNHEERRRQVFFTCKETKLDSALTKFWSIDTIPENKLFTAEERKCEEHFSQTAKRDADGRYIVQLPMKNEAVKLGQSFPNAHARFLMLEKRLYNNPDIFERYKAFIEEYLQLDHMEVVETPIINSETTFYLPHHPVFKESSTTTKLRVVFDASMKTDNDKSLNDLLMIGPILHNDLFSIIVRFRCYKIAISADIIKMYRQILIDKEHRDYQRILWRNNRTEDIKIYRLKTVTYGTASAPYLATKCLHQLADDEDCTQLTKQTIKENFYVDDLMKSPLC